MNSEENRFSTFHNWPTIAPIDTHHLARDGFFATGNNLEVECHWCHIRINNWEHGDQISYRHKSIEPLCPFIVNNTTCGNIPIVTNTNSGVLTVLEHPHSSSQHPADLHIEANRLATFRNWPNPNISPQSLAKAGFFYLNRSDEVKCAWCKGVIAKWEQQDNAFEEHKRFFPECPRVLLNTLEDIRWPFDLHIETNRLSTFKNWPNTNISPQSLAKAGFYYLNRSDEVKCAWCNGVIAKWEKQDNAFEEHKRFFPDCPRVQLGPLIEIASDGIRDLGIQQISPPKKPKYSSLDARLRTYNNWPISDIQRPEGLAQAGLYYQEVDDQVRCFHCNIGLRSWQKEDDPWFEHAKWYPQCKFVKLVKGANYIQHVQQVAKHYAQQSSAVIMPSMTIDEAMTSVPVLQALEIGIDGGTIRNATNKYISMTGRPYDTVDDLLKSIFEDRKGEDTTGDLHEYADAVEGAGASIIHDISSVSSFRLCDEVSAAVNSTLPNSIYSKESSKKEVNPSNRSAAALNTNETQSSETSINKSLSLEEENRKLKDARLCKICLDDEVGVVFLPCGHLVTCVQCAPGVNQCPMCRCDIKGFVRTYLS